MVETSIDSLRRPITVDLGGTEDRLNSWNSDNGSLVCVNPQFRSLKLFPIKAVLLQPGSFLESGLPNSVAEQIEVNMVFSWLIGEVIHPKQEFIDPLLAESRRIAIPGSTLQILEDEESAKILYKYLIEKEEQVLFQKPAEDTIRQRSSYAVELGVESQWQLPLIPIALLIVQL